MYCMKHKHEYPGMVLPSFPKEKCPYCEIDRVNAELRRLKTIKRYEDTDESDSVETIGASKCNGCPQYCPTDLETCNGSCPSSELLVSDQKDIVVTINHGLDDYCIEFIQQIEKRIDAALAGVGFARSTTSKGDVQVLNYYQFGFLAK